MEAGAVSVDMRSREEYLIEEERLLRGERPGWGGSPAQREPAHGHAQRIRSARVAPTGPKRNGIPTKKKRGC